MTMSNHGLSKAIEEMGEALQVFGKKLACMDTNEHWDGGKLLNVRMQEEIADVKAIFEFLCVDKRDHFHLDPNVIYARTHKKLKLFREWEARVDKPDVVANQRSALPLYPHYLWTEQLAAEFDLQTETIFPIGWYPVGTGPLANSLKTLHNRYHSGELVEDSGKQTVDTGRVIASVRWEMQVRSNATDLLVRHLNANFKSISASEMSNRISNTLHTQFYSMARGNTYTVKSGSPYGGLVLDELNLFQIGTGPFDAATPYTLAEQLAVGSSKLLQWWDAKFVRDSLRNPKPPLSVFFDGFMYLKDYP